MIGTTYMRPLLWAGGVYLLSGITAVSLWRVTGPSSRAAHAVEVVASALWLPGSGRGAIEVSDAVWHPRRPGLHPHLHDLHGFPATVAGGNGVDEAGAAWVVDRAANEVADIAIQRALALLRPVAEDLLSSVLPEAAPGLRDADAGPAMHPYTMHHSQLSAPAAERVWARQCA